MTWIKHSSTESTNSYQARVNKFYEFGQLLLQTPEHQKIAFIRAALRDKKMLHVFGRYFFPKIIQGFEDVPECHIDLTDEISRRADSAVIFPRGHSKSTWEKIDTLHDIVYGIEPVILYIGATMTDASFHFESIKSELENNDLLITVFGNLVPHEGAKGRKWTNKHFETTNGVNCVARGAGRGRGVNIKNQRPTKIVCDDIESDEQVRSTDRRIKLNRWLYDVIFPSKDARRGFIKMIGTVLSQHCEILRFYNKHGGIFKSAIENGQSIWPAMFLIEKLDEIKEAIGTRAFSQEYLNKPINTETAIIKKEWIEENYYSTLDAKMILFKVIMMDPQAGVTKQADLYGLAVVGFYKGDKHRYLLNIMSGRDTQINQAALLVKTYQENENVTVVGVEKIMTQVAVYQLILDWKAGRIKLPGVNNDDRNIPILAVEPKGKDKVARMQMHESAFERGEIHLHQTMTAFAERLTCFPELDHDDDIDAFLYSLENSYKSNFTFKKKSDYNSNRTIVGNVFKKQF